MSGIVAWVAAFVMASNSSLAQGAGALDELLDMDLARLNELKVSIAARVPQEAFLTPAAVVVLTRDDIQRSGFQRLPDLLRMVPGLHVGKGDANKWGISARNGMSRFTSTMLVMIDGRHVYTPLFGGVRWEIQALALDDIDRIEIVRGPGGPLWGANAVDGIVHIVTRRAADTQGSAARLAVGQGDVERELWWRHGATAAGGALAWRLSAHHVHSDTGDYLPAAQSTHRGQRQAGQSALDSGGGSGLTLRAEWSGQPAERLTMQAGVRRHRFDEERVVAGTVRRNPIAFDAGHAQALWERSLGGGAQAQPQVTLDRVNLRDDILVEQQSLFDVDFQHTAGGPSSRLTWGLGLRHYRSRASLPDTVPCNTCFGLWPGSAEQTTLSAFAQQEHRLRDDVALTAGAKLEHNSQAGTHLQPTLRLAWSLSPGQQAWFALTRPVRTPTRVDRDQALFNVAPTLAGALGCVSYEQGTCLLGNRDAPTWKVRSLELGYRSRPSDALGLDVAAFHTAYRYGTTGVASIARSSVVGVEALARYRATRGLMLEAGWTRHQGEDRYGSGAVLPVPWLPPWELGLRWQWRLTDALRFDGSLERVARTERRTLTSAAAVALPAYTRLQARWGWRLSEGVELSLSGQLPGGRGEYLESLKVNTGVRRSLLLALSVQNPGL